MGVIITPRKFEHKYNFLVEIDGFDWSGWKDASELKSNCEKIEHREGAGRIMYEEAGLITYEPLTLTRGATPDKQCYEWFQEVHNAGKNAGLVNPSYKRNGALVALDEENEEVTRWRFYSSFPISFTAGSWDKTVSEFTMEQVVLTYSYFDLAG
jgi:phage tail-like protein